MTLTQQRVSLTYTYIYTYDMTPTQQRVSFTYTYIYIYIYIYMTWYLRSREYLSRMHIYKHTTWHLHSTECLSPIHIHIHMGWLQLVGSIKLYVSFAKEPYKRDDILQKRPVILSILLTVAIPYDMTPTQQRVCLTYTYIYRHMTWYLRSRECLSRTHIFTWHDTYRVERVSHLYIHIHTYDTWRVCACADSLTYTYICTYT